MDLPFDFDWKIYLFLNDDIQNMSKEEAENHYIKNKDKRIYKYDLPEDFDWFDYITINSEIFDEIKKENDNKSWIKLKEKAKKHYTLVGKNENRCYKKDYKIKNKNIVIISSKIYISTVSWTYSRARSCYSTEERYSQTFETIESIRNNIPDSFIVLFDNSLFSLDEYVKLKKAVDCFINITDDLELNFNTNLTRNKLIPELSQLVKLNEVFMKKINVKEVKNMFKITGRYILNSTFNYEIFDNDENQFKRDKNIKKLKYYFTSFFKISSKNIVHFFEEMQKVYENKEKYLNLNFEEMVPMVLNYNFIEMNHLGLTQRIAVNRDVTKI
jgi:hypothetical protein